MKRRPTAIIIVLCFLMFLSLYLWWNPISEKLQPAVPFMAKTAVLSATNALTSSSPKATPEAKSKEQRMSALLALSSLTPISFFGKIVDQHGNPVPNAKVRGSAEIVKRWMNQEWIEHYTITDAQGFFSFSGLHGQSLVIFPAKEGYEFKSNNARFNYSSLYSERYRHRPESSSPVVFTMWKLKGAERLAHVRFDRLGVPVNNTPTSFDLLAGRKIPNGGDMILRVRRQPEHIRRGEPFDWEAVVEAPNGGVAELKDTYGNEAPDRGYVPQLIIVMPANSREWQSSVTRSFYLKGRDGKLYARLTLRITADYEPPPTGVTLEAFVNPSGSRNLEYDPSKPVFVR